MIQLTRDIQRHYEQLRDQNALELQRRKELAYATVPKLKSVEDELSQLSLQLMKQVLLSPDAAENAAKEVRHIADALRHERAFLLTENNFETTYLDPLYTCKVCKDTGFTEKGKHCACYRQKMVETAFEMSSISNRMQLENFETFNLDLFEATAEGGAAVSPKENMKAILATCHDFINHFSSATNTNLLFHGSPGLGKTFLCNAIAKELIERGNIVLYQTAFKLFQTIEEFKFSDKRDEQIKQQYQLIFDCDLLIIDDLGSELTNSFTSTELFNIINTRMISDRKMLISTNLQPGDFTKIYGDRVASRILGTFNLNRFIGRDIRWL